MRALPEPLPSSRSGSARRTASLVLSLLLACGALASCRGETPSAPVKGEAPRLVFSLHRLNLDGVGSIDDRAAVFIRGDASTTVEVRLGTGEELSWTYDHPDLAFSRQVLTSAYLSTKDHQALLLQAALSHTDHDAAQYIILEVENGRLTEQGRLAEDDPASLAPGQFTTQSQVTRLPDGSMQVLRVLLKDPDGQADRWHLLAWEDGAFTLTPQPVPDLAYLLMREHHNFPYDAPYMSSQLLLSREGDGCVLGLALVEGGTHSAGMGNLMVGLWDLEPQQWQGQVHLLGGDNGLWSSWTAEDGALHILCANTSAHSGWEGPSNAAHYRFDGSTLEELASWDYYDEDYKAVPREGGLDLYSFNPQYEFQFHNPDYSGVPLPSQWIYSHFQPLA